MLLSYYLENINIFDLNSSLKKVMNIYNKTKHNITKYSPNEVFYSINESLWKKIYNNIMDYYNKNNKENKSFKLNEKALMMNNFIKLKHKNNKGYIILMKNKLKKNKSFIKICVISN